MINKFIIGLIGIILLTGIATCIYDDIITFKEEKTKPNINLLIDINNCQGVYTLTLEGEQYFVKMPLEINSTNYKITNLSTDKNLKQLDIFNFYVSNTTKIIDKDKIIMFTLKISGNGYIIDKRCNYD